MEAILNMVDDIVKDGIVIVTKVLGIKKNYMSWKLELDIMKFCRFMIKVDCLKA